MMSSPPRASRWTLLFTSREDLSTRHGACRALFTIILNEREYLTGRKALTTRKKSQLDDKRRSDYVTA